MNKLLIICGPTATGKTNLALQLIKLFDSEVISADSRQVYKYMDIGTGKDVPADSGIKIYGIDLVDPKEKYSVFEYQKYAREKINQILASGKLPILVGGSGFYIKSVVDGVSTIDMEINQQLRDSLSSKSAFELFNMLARINPQRAKTMNISDRNNPRRLIRAIEIYSQLGENDLYKEDNFNVEPLFIGLNLKQEVLLERIRNRVEKRLKQGMAEEVESLLRRGVAWGDQSMATPGYRQFKDYLDDTYGLGELIEKWTQAEAQYAKRQMTWFKKDQRINWFDAEDREISQKVANLVKIWYI